MISPLLANAYLHELDVEMREAGLVMVRYADDAVVMCRSREEADAALTRMRAWVSANGLTLHPDKTHGADVGLLVNAGLAVHRFVGQELLQDCSRCRGRIELTLSTPCGRPSAPERTFSFAIPGVLPKAE